jgi:hypothetical protein
MREHDYRAIIHMLKCAANTHYARRAIRRFKELNGIGQEVKDFFLNTCMIKTSITVSNR